MYFEKSLKSSSFIQKYKIAIRNEEIAIKKDKNYIYALHKYADIIAKMLEYNIEISESCTTLTEKCIPRKYVDKALEFLDIVLENKPRYARAYYTRAQIKLALDELSDAENDIMLAIDYEDPDSVDYQRRLTDYFVLRQNIRLFKRMNVKIDNVINELSSLERKILEQTEQKIMYLIAIISIMLTFVFTSSRTYENPIYIIINSIILYVIIISIVLIYYYLDRKINGKLISKR